MNSAYSNKKFIIDTNAAPRAIGPYSQGVTYGGLLFVSGQIPVDPQSGEIVAGGVEAQTRQVMNNLQAVLMAAGLDFSHVLKTTVFLRNMNDYSLMNDVYGLYFDYSPPARACVEVSRLPKDVLVEIECVAAAPTDYEQRIAGDDDTGGEHPTPDDWEAEHVAQAKATHSAISGTGDADDDDEPSVEPPPPPPPNLEVPLATGDFSPPQPDPSHDDISEVDALDALDALQEEESGESPRDADFEPPVPPAEGEEVVELDEDSVIESVEAPPEVPTDKDKKKKKPRPAPPRLAKLKLPPKRNGNSED